MRIALIACALLLSTFFTVNASANQTDAEFREHYAAALQGQSNSQLIVGRILLEGGGSVRQDISKARIFLDRAIKSGNGAAAKYTAQQYENGKLLGKNLDKALKYYKEAKRSGITGLDSKILELTEALRGSHSQESCIQYGKNDRSRARDLAICAEKGFISADASKYWLWVFEKGDAEAFIKAATTRLNSRGAAYDPQSIITGFPKFFVERASDAQKDALKALIRDLGFGGLDCASGQDAFGFVKDPDVVGCLVSAAGGDADAAPQASKWWRNGEHGLIRNEAYADYLVDGLLRQPPGGGNGDGPALANLCVALESDPKKHFQMLKEYLGANPFNRESVASCLKLEMELIASGKVPEFATGAAEVAWVLEHVDWNALPPELIARSLIKLKTDYKSVPELQSPAVLGNINQIKFSEPWIQQFWRLDPAMDKSTSKAMIGKYLDNSCEAVRYVLFNPQSADWDQYFGLKNLTECIPFNETMILQVAGTDKKFSRRLLGSYVMETCEAVVFAQQNTDLVDMDVLSISPIFQQCLADIPEGNAPDFESDPKGAALYLLSRFVGSREDQCEPFFDYWMNREVFDRYVREDQRPEIVLSGEEAVNFCANVNGDMAGLLAKREYLNGSIEGAYTLSKKACRLLHYPSCGLQAHLMVFKNIKELRDVESLSKKRKAINIAQRAYQNGEDSFSGLVLYDIENKSLLSKKKKADDLLSELLAKGIPGAKIREAGKCINKVTFIVDCSAECAAIDRALNNKEIDYLSREIASKYLGSRRCN